MKLPQRQMKKTATSLIFFEQKNIQKDKKRGQKTFKNRPKINLIWYIFLSKNNLHSNEKAAKNLIRQNNKNQKS